MQQDLPERFGIEAQSPYLQQPITKKHTQVGKGKIAGKEIRWSLSSMQGWRVTMEDAHSHVLPTPFNPNIGFFGVFDGHGGDLAAKTAASTVLGYIEKSDAYQSYLKSGDKNPNNQATALAKAVMEGFVDADEAMKEMGPFRSGADFSGSTGVVALITETHVIFGNTGDSRGFLFSNGRPKFATVDQKPSDEKEVRRVEAAGGTVQDGRINGDLASARSFGDFRYKLDDNLPPSKQQVTVLPETTIIPRTPEDEFLVLACDGIYDVQSTFECAHLCYAGMRTGCGLGLCCERVLDECLLKASGDNCSIMIIAFPAAPKEIGKAKPGKEPSLDVIRENMITHVI